MRSYLIAAILALVLVQTAYAAEVSLSGFGTIGYAISDKEYSYQRFVDDNGTIKRDTVSVSYTHLTLPTILRV